MTPKAAFTKAFTDAGGKIVGVVRFPPTNPDFAPFVQRIKDAKPDVVFIFVAGRHPGDRDDEGDQAISACARPGSTSIAPQDLLPDEELPQHGRRRRSA